MPPREPSRGAFRAGDIAAGKNGHTQHHVKPTRIGAEVTSIGIRLASPAIDPMVRGSNCGFYK
ncbi:MAG TPA: hypothetical protein VMV78_07095 [Thiobacillus sp.]|nr:hypothetical protein [Thiobacillus sp.]